MTTTQPAELHNGVWTSWLPVTTAWTSQSACNSAVWARYGIQPSNNYWPYIYDPAYGQSVANTPTCLPPQATQWWDGDVTSTGTITRFSLGPIVCPGAYTTVSTSLVSDSSTSVICCPSNFDFVRGLAANEGLDGICTSAMTSGQSIVYANPVIDDSATFNSYTTATTTYTASGLLVAVPVEGYNFATSTSSSSQIITTSALQTTGTSTGTNNSSSAGPTTSSTSAKSSGLTTGAKAGIGVGAAAAVIIVAAILAVFAIRRRRKGVVGASAQRDGRSELPGNEGTKTGAFFHQNEPQEMYQRTVSEVDGNPRPVELQ